MAEDFDYVAPYPIINPRNPMGRVRADYDSGLAAASQWVKGDLVEVNASGDVQKCIQTTPANIRKLAFAPAPYSVTPLDTTRHSYYKDRGIPLDTLPDDSLVVFTYQAATADASDHTFTAGDLTSVQNQESRELVYNTAQGVLTIRAGTTNPNVKMIALDPDCAVGDSNVKVRCQILDDFRMGA